MSWLATQSLCSDLSQGFIESQPSVFMDSESTDSANQGSKILEKIMSVLNMYLISFFLSLFPK
jgi:hypothetical protein